MTGLRLTESTAGALAIIRAAGDIDVYTVPEFRESLLRMEERGHSRILLDLSACTFLDAPGLAAIAAGQKRARERGGALSVSGAPEPVLKAFRITGLINVLAVYETRDQAVAAMAVPEGGSADA